MTNNECSELKQYGFELSGYGHVVTPSDVLRLYFDVPRNTVYNWLRTIPRVQVGSHVRLYLMSDITRVFNANIEAREKRQTKSA